MPWVTKLQLIKMLQDQRHKQPYTLDMLLKDIHQYEKRKRDSSQCECYTFGLYDDYPTEYEYFVCPESIFGTTILHCTNRNIS